MPQKTHTRWSLSLKSGEARETKDGKVRFTNKGRSTVNLLVEVAIEPQPQTDEAAETV